ncbi:hypothetical protein CDAR_43881 [Caerostris darwini]|uniref:Uncharacterized protein n=1 Tax=Caerostris darwini TaxID=1538125 RepID=A0AAV4WJL3_9ARAC|nr:hypothetical protein CDAR_43881 [Caerostris darwini]
MFVDNVESLGLSQGGYRPFTPFSLAVLKCSSQVLMVMSCFPGCRLAFSPGTSPLGNIEGGANKDDTHLPPVAILIFWCRCCRFRNEVSFMF